MDPLALTTDVVSPSAIGQKSVSKAAILLEKDFQHHVAVLADLRLDVDLASGATGEAITILDVAETCDFACSVALGAVHFAQIGALCPV